MDSREALVALNMVEHVGPVRVRQLLEHFGEAPKILSASRQQLLHVRGIGEETAESIASWEKSVDLKAELERISDSGCEVVIQSDPHYPEMLREIYDPPIVLYVKGKLTAKDKNSVAIVGSRMTTHYGIEVARKLAYQLAYVGVTVVSGGARGIDTAGHQVRYLPKGARFASWERESISYSHPRTTNCSSALPQTARSSRNILSIAKQTSSPLPFATALSRG
jgi:DNA processing protein